jgi:tRNA uridine 5-carbamoylmethylation protein Kti12
MNPKMREYCIKSTNDSIRKMTEKYNEERKSNKIKFDNFIVITKDDSPDPIDNNIILSIICLLSSTTLFYYFYKASR